MPLLSRPVGKPFFSLPMLALSLLISVACFQPLHAQAPAVQRTLGPSVSRLSARSIAQGAVTHPASPRQTRRVPQTKPGIPRRIDIPSVGIAADVLSLGLLLGGKLDAPQKREDTGWYRGSKRPGEAGTAVIDGHLNTAQGPGAFWNLKNVKAGDLIAVTDEHGVTRNFQVRKTAVYPVHQAPMREIFTSTDGTHLNLITCAGKWSLKLDHYDKRLIVFADAVNSDLRVATK
jgi:LPXTG-site transpeptidase (sortase) family protein